MNKEIHKTKKSKLQERKKSWTLIFLNIKLYIFVSKEINASINYLNKNSLHLLKYFLDNLSA